MNILFSWLGTKDIENMLDGEQNASISTTAIKSQVPFDKIVILSNHKQEHWERFERFVKKRMSTINRPAQDIQVYKANIDSPIDYEAIHQETETWVTKLSEQSDTLSINLTSGTGAMTALSVLIGKGKANVQFLQTTPKNELLQVEIPIDFGQEYVKSASKNIANTAASLPKIDSAFSDITAQSNAMKNVVDKAKRIARSEVPALILGDTGTGKELMANAIHQGSLRANKPIKIINCGALSENLVDSTLFGHKKGAFTGAEKDHPGLFEQADGGTLFLDEVGELSLSVQVKLLRALQQGEVIRLGDTKTINVDVRIIAATHQDLSTLVKEGKFREDLYYRLAVGIIFMPTLSDRVEDIPLIVGQLIEQINASGSKHPEYISKNISDNGIKFILSQSWFGNIRELWSTLNRAFLWTDSEVITEKHMLEAMLNRSKTETSESIELAYNDKVDIIQLTENYQKKYVLAALKASGNVKNHATKMLGLKDHQTLSNWMKRLRIENQK
ncbi:sigma-54 dependent transcriptional regulator [Psychrosphaera sp. 1_MG-2023]|uniref:sigma-54 interaction domain-containing protein n=1 Tax=Psychrosphaera sp. 1_MG-2023 TaxID=3062643 RepID=UPI0026E28789|nr:sigma-54 dependent transcriptional regulator [Psychrosphaera sp. 1_MG-2023]MDO6718702.1 sigma-54 dependent transcriptional regulator [Psychrosphaera sp. 1_MG-2023]